MKLRYIFITIVAVYGYVDYHKKNLKPAPSCVVEYKKILHGEYRDELLKLKASSSKTRDLKKQSKLMAPLIDAQANVDISDCPADLKLNIEILHDKMKETQSILQNATPSPYSLSEMKALQRDVKKQAEIIKNILAGYGA